MGRRPAPPRICQECARTVKYLRVFLEQRLCDACFMRRRRAAAPCPGCDQLKVLAFYDDQQRPACAACTGNTASFGCRRCGREDNVFGSCCAPCTLHERLTALLSDDTGAIHPRLRPVYDALLASTRPQTTLYWLTRRSARPDILRLMARGEMAISHTAFDELPCDRNVNYVRDLLAATGVLPPYQPVVARIPPWLDELLAAEPKQRADLVHRFARWHILRKLHLLGDQVTRSSATNARAWIVATIKFLTWLDHHGTAISHLTQGFLDLYLVDHPGHASMLIPFIEWTTRTGLTCELTIPRPPVPLPVVVLSDEQRWAHVETLLHDNTIRLNVRISGLFMLLFAQPLSRICRMRAHQITVHPDTVTVAFDTEPIELPTHMDQLVREHLTRPGWASYISQADNWLFPGGIPGKHLTRENIRAGLAVHGIVPGDARKAALFQLAAAMPIPVLADLLGLAPNTAARWAALAARDWSQYAALRHEDHQATAQ